MADEQAEFPSRGTTRKASMPRPQPNVLIVRAAAVGVELMAGLYIARRHERRHRCESRCQDESKEEQHGL